jgi:hypothetical protein
LYGASLSGKNEVLEVAIILLLGAKKNMLGASQKSGGKPVTIFNTHYFATK